MYNFNFIILTFLLQFLLYINDSILSPLSYKKKSLTAAFAALLLVGCGNEDSDTVSQNDRDLGVESQILKAVAGEQTDECSVHATWTGDIEGSVDWVPEKSPIVTGFSIDYKSFKIETRRFDLTANFETPFEKGKTGTFSGKATYFYVTDAPYVGPQEMGKLNIYFPMDGDRVARGVQVTLEITQWQDAKISGSVSAGPFTGVANGPQAPRDGDGPNSPLKPITVSGSAQFQASGKITNALFGRTECHNPYAR